MSKTCLETFVVLGANKGPLRDHATRNTLHWDSELVQSGVLATSRLNAERADRIALYRSTTIELLWMFHTKAFCY